MNKAAKIRSCPGCGHGKFTRDIQASAGDLLCLNCGMVQEENPIVSEVQFGESASGAAMVQGAMVGADQARANFNMRNAMESREQTILNAKKKIKRIANVMRIPDYIVESASGWFKLALVQNFVQGRRSQNVIAACLYVACRHEKTHHLLIDFSSRLQISVYLLGATYLKLVRALQIQRLPLADPSLFIQHFAEKLSFGEHTAKVCRDATKIAHRMSSDWIYEGRRPAGIAGACLLLAARMNNFRRTHAEIVAVARVGEETLQKRLNEFKKTTSGSLTILDFRDSLNTNDSMPPSYIKNRRIEEKIRKLLQQRETTLKRYRRLAKKEKLMKKLFPERGEGTEQVEGAVEEGVEGVEGVEEGAIIEGTKEGAKEGANEGAKEGAVDEEIEEAVEEPTQEEEETEGAETIAEGAVAKAAEEAGNEAENEDTEMTIEGAAEAESEEVAEEPEEEEIQAAEKTTEDVEDETEETIDGETAAVEVQTTGKESDLDTPPETEDEDEGPINDLFVPESDDEDDGFGFEDLPETAHEVDEDYEPTRAFNRRLERREQRLRTRQHVEEECPAPSSARLDNISGSLSKKAAQAEAISASERRENRKRESKKQKENDGKDRQDRLMKAVLEGGSFTEEDLEMALDRILQSQRKSFDSSLYQTPAELEKADDFAKQIDLDRPRNLVKNNPTTEEMLAKVRGSEILDDDDDDDEVDSIKLSPDEKLQKERIWTALNHDFLIAQEKKRLKLEADELTGNTSGQTRKRRRVKEQSVDPMLNDAAVNSAIKLIGEVGKSITPAESAKQMLQRKSFSRKINYDTIGDLFDTL